MLNNKHWYDMEFADSEDLHALILEAGKVRDSYWGDTVTYSRKVFVPLTNMCRDECGYCTFVKHPDNPAANIMTLSSVSETLRAGDQLGCKEALFSLGEKPELRYPKAANMLNALGYVRMLDYLRDMCEFTLRETNLIPHVNAGTLTETEIKQLKPVSASMGMMLESLSMQLMRRGGPHYRCPDKSPKLRLQTLENAGKHQVPFTTGLLIGIGETWQDRIDALLAINDIHRQHGHIQEVIIQNFKAKPGTAMASVIEPDIDEMLKTLAVARLLLDPSISLQAPPNLQQHHSDYLAAGINDWGGISPLTQDFINPECAWPNIDTLAESCTAKGFQLRERLTVYPDYLTSEYVDASIINRLIASADVSGLVTTFS
ncbi:7,8-didemethyl-8-hydroxy-5-deazariboflavin synthase CofG [Aestuariicella hydrocarbonica]|uniref:7,8-didemethyl-8-hydroxy-5-deazariboflavin synthase n=1 Tax=Pseudomaricurvus hydrocarbonicus TaxID=1470433 RepID=A0A9E5JVY1_9GAMM|nr:7,8-didemethyl-8-hydroxy-5-deazariboflavin synthase CofG [Aestuariicella hydrocarbonica]NHO65875.1 7,8-didemethyl-8-hydroxy-5-deazariboflavin synthase CofG [Aestuariicella hydrocarbonica]